MTRDEILNMPAGREMNALIAEKVTGWKAIHAEYKCNGEYFFRCDACGGYGHGNCYGNGDGAIQIKCGEYTVCCDEAEMPAYSTDISAAWEVVEKMKADGWEFYFEWKDEPWALFENDECLLDKYADADTVPLAICKAALLMTLE
jgi:hypothetical protein